MNIFVQGMRRSGTTIAYDILCADGRFDCYYEPLSAGEPKLGGGSGAQSVDVSENVHQLRLEYLARERRSGDAALLNYGAPRQPELELEADLPDFVRDYLAAMLRRSEHSMVKFTRMYRKVRVLWELDPKAAFVHVVRDPRAVVASYLFGEQGKHRRRFRWKRRFFTRSSDRLPWAAYALSERLLETEEFRHLRGCPDFLRALLVWKVATQKVLRDVARPGHARVPRSLSISPDTRT